MQTGQKIAVLFFLSVGFTNGQDDGLLGLPVDFDDFGLDFRNVDLYKDQDIFKDDTYSENTNISPEETIRSLCNEYDLILNDQRIDCTNIKFTQKVLNIDEHQIHKRDVSDDAQLDEGSGGGEEESAIDPLTNEGESVPDQIVEEPKENDTAPSESDDVKPSEDVPSEYTKEEPAPDTPVEEPAPESPEEEPTPESPVEEPAPESPVEEPAPESPVEEPVPYSPVEENPVEQPNEPPLEEGKEGEQPKEESPAESAMTYESATTASAVVQELGAAEADGIKKKGRMYRPDTTEPDKEAAENTETVKEHQSGVAVLQSPGKETLAATDEAVDNMEPNAKLNSQEKTGESAREVKEGRKDTKVLIILFVVVVVVGSAAFAYNFIKKRKQKKEEAATENGGNNTTQNNSSKPDPEHGTELKPLMKNAEQKPVVAEYTDEKDNVKIEEDK